MRGVSNRARGMAVLCAVVLCVLAACGKVENAIDAGNPPGTPDAADTPDAPEAMPDALLCEPNSMSCVDDAVFACNADGTELAKVTDCQYGCADGACKACAASTTFCNGDALAMCNAAGQIGSMTPCEHGCQMDRCNTCDPDTSSCVNEDRVDCSAEGTPGTPVDCGANGCNENLGLCNTCAGTGLSCVGDSLISCNNGTVESATTCAFGCSATGGPHCRVLTPSFGVPVPSNVAAFNLDVNASTTMDISGCTGTPNTVKVTIGSLVTTLVGSPQVALITTQGSGDPAICIVRYNNINVRSGQTLTITNTASDGSSANVTLSLGAQNTFDVQGTIAFRNGGTGRSKGTNTTAVDPPPSGSDHHAAGPGGAGHIRAGGSGGACAAGGCGTAAVPGAAGGAALAAATTKLLGGSKGGDVFKVGSTTVQYGFGGLGGGGLHLIALNGFTVGATGRLDVNARGGTGKSSNIIIRSDPDLPAGGGGSGGTIVVEASVVTMSTGAVAAANGGGGAGGCYVCDPRRFSCTHQNGISGALSATRAAGGSCSAGGNGGSAANGVTNPSPNGQSATSSGGGGGGSDGVIILKGRDTQRVQLNGIVSPTPTVSAVTAN